MNESPTEIFEKFKEKATQGVPLGSIPLPKPKPIPALPAQRTWKKMFRTNLCGSLVWVMRQDGNFVQGILRKEGYDRVDVSVEGRRYAVAKASCLLAK